MTAPIGMSNLTGATRYRSGWFGGLILQVEEYHKVGYRGRPRLNDTPTCLDTKWRDAKIYDLRLIEYLESAKAGVSNFPPPDRSINE